MKWPTQNQTCSIAAVITGALCLTLLVIPGLVFWLFNMAYEAEAAIMSRRAAMLFAGFSFLAWRVRDLAVSAATQAVFHAFAVAMAGLALVGTVEFIRGGVGIGIVLAIGVELFFVLAFMRLAHRAN